MWNHMAFFILKIWIVFKSHQTQPQKKPPMRWFFYKPLLINDVHRQAPQFWVRTPW